MDDEDGFRTQRPPSGNAILTLAREPLALLVPIAGALIFAFRCFVVSAGDPYVARILATQTSIGDAIRVLFFAVIPVVLFMLWLGAGRVAWRGISARSEDDFKTWRDLEKMRRDRKTTRLDSQTGPNPKAWWRDLRTGWRELKTRSRHLRIWHDRKTLGMALATAPLWFGFFYFIGGFQGGFTPVAIIIIGLSQFFIFLSPLAPVYQPDRISRILRALLVVSLIFFAFMLLRSSLLDRTFWLPPERLVFQNQDKNRETFTGYVLKVSEDYLIILKDRPRVIIERKKDSLEDRAICHPKPSDAGTVSEKVQSHTPVCP
jgi:hypothetical protein